MEPITIPDLSARPLGFKVERIMKSQPDVLYRAWTEKFDEWFAEPGTLIMKAEVNSVFFFETVFKTSEQSEKMRHPHYGRFLKLVPDSLIEFTWLTGADGTKGAETVVTIELEPRDNGTLLSLEHKGFPDEESKGRHDDAWVMILEYLDEKMK
ncbi:SRPBCC family protein [Mesobacillus subterraneus]|uniref:SRPBCC domain-containing protein n=1 Tax=Mesobacillus subterraneus TaxID=285983 RepID=A0A3R9EEA6_9BACI|nr:SRPBCC domain-containing protein [Mesobacillus subterraneus]RSD28407.1 SRPBCC domain-containing protein [Mesobacillus subterraneus]